MKLIIYELRKIISVSHLLFFLVLIGLNTITIYVMESKSAEYKKVDTFIGGDQESDGLDQREDLKKEQKAYSEEYSVFLEEMRDRAESVSVLNSKANSFVVRNAEKTVLDFEGCTESLVNPDLINEGFRRYCSYNIGFLFVITFSAFIMMLVCIRERENGMSYLLKTTKNGRYRIALSKYVAMLIVIICFTLIIEGLTLFCFDKLYSFNELDWSVQSCSLFRNCNMLITAGQTIALSIMIRLLAVITITSVLFLIGMFTGNSSVAVFIMAIVFAVLLFLEHMILLSSAFNWIKCINPFYVWDITDSFGTYLNLDLFGYPVNKLVASVVIFLGICLISSMLGCYIFSGKSHGLKIPMLEKVIWIFNRLTCKFYEHVLLFFLESGKLLFMKRGILLIILAVSFCGVSILKTYQMDYYATEEEAAYHYYMNKIEGPVTDGKISYLYDEKLINDAIVDGYDEVNESEKKSAKVKKIVLSDIFSQVEKMQASGNLYDKYFVDEKSYIHIWDNTSKMLLDWGIAAVIVIILSGMISEDYCHIEKYYLINVAKRGRAYLRNTKLIITFIFSLIVIAFCLAPEIYRYYRIDEFTTLYQMLSDFYFISSDIGYNMLQFMILTLLIKGISIMIISFMTFWINYKWKNRKLGFILMMTVAVLVLVVLGTTGTNIEKVILGGI